MGLQDKIQPKSNNYTILPMMLATVGLDGVRCWRAGASSEAGAEIVGA